MRQAVLRIVQVSWMILTVWSAVIVLISFPASFHQLSHPPHSVLSSLHYQGVSVGLYAGYLTAVNAIFALGCFAVAGFVAWRRFNNSEGLLTSLFLILLAAGDPTSSTPVAEVYPALAALANALLFLMLLSMLAFLMTFPDGRVVPRRATLPLVFGTVVFVVLLVTAEAGGGSSLTDQFVGVMIGALLFGLGSQVYRFLRVSSPDERQQIKWVVLGVSIAIISQVVLVAIPVPDIGPPGTPYNVVGVTILSLTFLLIPISIGIAILRYRLWDVDVLINRTLVYGSLTLSLGLLYLFCVIGLQAVMRAATGQSSDVAIAIATLAVAALFNPWRRLLQSFIDRRFYRRKYDATKILAILNTHLRDEVDIDHLTRDILSITDEAVQPAFLSLWLRNLT